MLGRRKTFSLMAIMASVVLLVLGTSLLMLYHTSFEQRRLDLLDIVRSQSHLIEAVAAFDSLQYSDYPGGARAATIKQVITGYQGFTGYDEKVEFTIASRVADEMVFHFRRHMGEIGIPRPIAFDSELAEPMRRALSGTSGTVIGLDYRGVRVLAAHEPMPRLKLGLVAKLDIVEIRAPFFKASAVALCIALLLIVGGAFLFVQVTDPMLRQLEDNEARYRKTLAALPIAVVILRNDGRFDYVNDYFTLLFGYALETVSTMEDWFNAVYPDRAYCQLMRTTWERAISDARQSGRTVEPTYGGEVRCRDGKTLIIEFVARDMGGYSLMLLSDMTARYRAKLALNESQRRLSVLISNLQGMAYRCLNNRNWTMEFVSEGCLGLTGYTATEIMYDELASYASLIHREDRDAVWEAVQHALHIKKHYEIEYRIHTRTGQEKWVWEKGTGIFDDRGQLIKLEGFISDISDKKRIVLQLRSEKRFVEQVLDTQQDTFILFEPRAGRPVRWNRAFSVMTGYSDEEIAAQQGLSAFYSEEELQGALPLFRRVMEEGMGTVEMNLICKDGHGVPIEHAISTITDDLGEVKYLFSIGRNLTERKRAEEALKQSKADWEQIFNSIGQMAWILGADLRVIHVNHATVRMTGKTQQALIGISCNAFYAMLAASPTQCPERALWELGEAKAHIMEMRALHGVFVVSCTPVCNAEGEIEKIIHVATDITAQKALEAEIKLYSSEMEQRVEERTAELLEQKKQLEDSQDALTRSFEEVNASRADLERVLNKYKVVNEELEAFVYSVSHDLRAPLRRLSGFADLMIRKFEGRLGEDGRHYLERIMASSRLMGELIDDLLKLSRLAGQTLRLQDVDLVKLATPIADTLGHSSDGARVAWVCPQSLVVKGDKHLLKVLLVNLLENAWKFSSQAEQPKVELGSKHEAGRWVYYVKDNGAGFDMAYADKLFAPFQRLHTSDEFQGLGIGLATVKRIVTRHNGKIWARGEVNRGATFYFTLNLGVNTESQNLSAIGKVPGHGKENTST